MMHWVGCANRCPRHCWDLQEGLVCQEKEACEPGCRCPDGEEALAGPRLRPLWVEEAQGVAPAPFWDPFGGLLWSVGCANKAHLPAEGLGKPAPPVSAIRVSLKSLAVRAPGREVLVLGRGKAPQPGRGPARFRWPL